MKLPHLIALFTPIAVLALFVAIFGRVYTTHATRRVAPAIDLTLVFRPSLIFKSKLRISIQVSNVTPLQSHY